MTVGNFMLPPRRLLHQSAIFARAIYAAYSLHSNSAISLSQVIFQEAFVPITHPPLNLARRHRRLCSPIKGFQEMGSGCDVTNKEEKSYIDKIALILISSDRKQLVARSYGKQVFYTPGGKRQQGESDEETLIRECMEELSICLSTSTNVPAFIQPYGTFEAQAYGKAPGTVVRMTCFRLSPREAELELEKLVKASEEVEELKWVDSSFDREKLTVTGVMILEDLKEKGLID